MFEITMILLIPCLKLGISVPFCLSLEDVHIWGFTGNVCICLPTIDKRFYLFVSGLSVIFFLFLGTMNAQVFVTLSLT